ncbi:peptide-methionine (S)-S-oxide reductase [Saccharibacillus deserti]|uniref:peptide-methionine (S)-S-oxide reductase n=1 Tax=Saccharibacillus deserti TaxID=1634444 RepID=UPI001555914D|nr:peptide-methionine (S)-S-oxide reductase [Saccharibacillus deserti]
MPEQTPLREKLTFAMGCFWGPEDRFARVPGVTGTRVGYCGGDSPSGSAPPGASSSRTVSGAPEPAAPALSGPGPSASSSDIPASGLSPAPTHRRLAGHSEAVEVEFDPRIVSLEQLLAKFWSEHKPAAIEGYKPDDSRYRSILFYRNEEQRAAMERMQSGRTDAGRSRAWTGLRPLGVFYPAEEKHQRYEEKKRARTRSGEQAAAQEQRDK